MRKVCIGWGPRRGSARCSACANPEVIRRLPGPSCRRGFWIRAPTGRPLPAARAINGGSAGGRRSVGSGPEVEGRCEYRDAEHRILRRGHMALEHPAGGAGGEPASGSVRFSARSPAGHSPSSRAFPFSNPRQHLVRRMRAAPCANQSVRAIPNPWRSQAISGDFPGVRRQWKPRLLRRSL